MRDFDVWRNLPKSKIFMIKTRILQGNASAKSFVNFKRLRIYRNKHNIEHIQTFYFEIDRSSDLEDGRVIRQDH